MSKYLTRFCGVPLVALALVACGNQSDSGSSTDAPVGEIVNISGNLYAARNSGRNAVFLVTPAGVILTDPMTAEVAQWLKAELSERFDSTVAYVIYSHHHPDHIAGGLVFSDTATFVAHEAVAGALAAALPSNAQTLDLNSDGRLDREEATGLAYDRDFDLYERNGDDSITGEEIYAETPVPDIVYSSQMTITLGGSTVELMHPGAAHSEDMTVVFFPEEGVVFGVDFMHVNRLPITLGGYPVARYAEAMARVQALDYRVAVPGHGEIGEKADLDAFLRFLQALEAGVSTGIAAGQSAEQLQENLAFPGYEGWLLYDVRRRNLIAEAYQLLTEP